MSEELKNASYTLARTLMAAAFIDPALGFVMLITVAYCIGEISSVLASPTGYPFIQIFFNSTGSYAGTNPMVRHYDSAFLCTIYEAFADRRCS
jgi:hypothetical protein